MRGETNGLEVPTRLSPIKKEHRKIKKLRYNLHDKD